MMRITSEGAGAIQPAYSSTAASRQSPQAQSTERTRGVENSFDQVDISHGSSSQSRFQQELAARLVQEVRTATGTRDVQQIKDQVQSGRYQVNPDAIASAMLLEGPDHE